MTDPEPDPVEISYYGTSTLYIRTRTGWRNVGVADDPMYIRTRTGWRLHPDFGTDVQIRTRTGWRTVVTGG